MTAISWRRVPVGEQSNLWNTIRYERRILVIVHNMTAADRLADILPVFHGDFRIQIVFTCPQSSPYSHDVNAYLANMPTIPWEQAVRTQFDLALAASHGGDLHEITAPLFIFPHGVGYSKYTPPGAVTQPSRKPLNKPLNKPGAGSRDTYRHALGAADGRLVIFLSSTWWNRSLFGSAPGLISRLLAALPIDEIRSWPHFTRPRGPRTVPGRSGPGLPSRSAAA